MLWLAAIGMILGMTALVKTISALEACYAYFGSVPTQVQPRDRLYIFATLPRPRHENGYTFRLEAMDGRTGRHLVEISREYRHVWLSRSILIIDPMMPLHVGTRYRLSVAANESSCPLHLPITSWTVTGQGKVWTGNRRSREASKKTVARTGEDIARGGYAQFVVVPSSGDPTADLHPAITGETHGIRSVLRVLRIAYEVRVCTVKLCVAAVPEAETSPERYFYVIESLSADGAWEWMTAWRPHASPDRDPRCAYVIKADILPGPHFARDPGRDFTRTGFLKFRPLLVHADGTRWRGPVRVIEVESSDGDPGSS